MSKTWTFVPTIDGEAVYDAEGHELSIDVDVPLDAETVQMHAYVDGKELTDKYVLPDKVYDVLKWVGLLLLPTLAWLYTSLAGAWGLPYAEEVPFTLNVLGTFVAVLIGASALPNMMKG